MPRLGEFTKLTILLRFVVKVWPRKKIWASFTTYVDMYICTYLGIFIIFQILSVCVYRRIGHFSQREKNHLLFSDFIHLRIVNQINFVTKYIFQNLKQHYVCL
jgi:hypothetical protein